MTQQVDAVYEKGVLRPLRPLDLLEHQLVTVTVMETGSGIRRTSLDVEYIERLRKEAETAAPAPGLEEVRRRLSKIPGSMTADFVASREDR